MTKQRKNLDFTDFCIETISIEAIKKKTDFKNYVQELAEHEAVRLAKKDKPK
jgi:hypothetical protein